MFANPTEPQASDKQLIGLALKVASRLSGNDISCSFAWFSECQWQMDAECDVAENHEKKMLSLSELLTMARELRLMIPENLDNDELSLISAAELRHCQPAPFLIDPIIRESSYAVMYGGTGVAKTWLALTVGLAVANGKDIFPGRWLIPEHSGGKVLYIAGEMTLGDFGPRVDRLLQKETGENFSFKRPLALDLVTPEGQAFVMKLVHECDYNFGDRGKRTRLIILDNLTTLASGGDLPANFNRILNLIERLKGRGIAVLLVHHENASGGIQGATIVTNVADMQLHLVRGTAKGDEISLLISTGKRRSVAASQVQSFKATLRVDVPNTTWKISQPSQDELAMLGEMDGAVNTRKLNKEDRIAWDLLLPRVQRYEVIRLHFLGCSDAEIAQALSTTTATIVEFRRKNELEADQLLQYRRWAFSVKTSFHDMKSARKVAEAINKYWENTSPNYNRAEDVRDEDENEEDETCFEP